MTTKGCSRCSLVRGENSVKTFLIQMLASHSPALYINKITQNYRAKLFITVVLQKKYCAGAKIIAY